MGNGIRLGRVAGIEVVADWSLLIIFWLIATALGLGLFPRWHPDWGAGLIWITALAAAVLFLASVFLHELSHALVGRAWGIRISRITLFVFGGMAQMEEEPRAWRAELWMALVGPVTSLAIGILCLTLGRTLAGPLELDPQQPARALEGLGPLPTLLFWLGPVNLILGVFNLVPGFPLDGGRVLRAALWGATGDLRLATRWASLVGQGFGWVLIFSGILMMLGRSVPVFGSGFGSGLWIVLIGWFLNSAALGSYRRLVVQENLGEVKVKELMQTHFIPVEPGLSVEELVDRHLLHSDQRAFPVMEGPRLLGLVCLHDIRQVPRQRWAFTRVDGIMVPREKLIHVAAFEPAAQVLERLTRHRVNQLPVLEDDRLVGLVHREDILKWLSLYGEQGAGLKV